MHKVWSFSSVAHPLLAPPMLPARVATAVSVLQDTPDDRCSWPVQ
jgi:hypothetical protein